MTIERVVMPNNLLDRVDELEKRLDDFLANTIILQSAPESPDDSPSVLPGNLIADLIEEGPDIDLVRTQTLVKTIIGRGGDTILLYHASGSPISEFAASAVGLAAALAAASAGDVVQLPPQTITGDYTIPAGVHVIGLARFGSVLTGQITGGAGASLENCSITRSANDASALYGVVAPATGTFYLSRVHVSVTQMGAGNAAAIYSAAGGNVEAWNCSLLAPAGGAGWHYGVRLDVAAVVYVEGGVCIGSTGATNWSP